MQHPSKLSKILSRYRHANLLACLVLVIGVSPFFAGTGVPWVFQGLLIVTLAAGAYAAESSGRTAAVLGLLAVFSVAAQVATSVYHEPHFLYGFLAGEILFFSAVAALLVRSMFSDEGHITLDTLCGAASVYLMFGLIWTLAYSLLESVAPGSFLFNGAVGESLLAGGIGRPEERFERFLGFSFATLTTLGYGNVAPATPRADALATMEAVVGQFFLAVVIARFVALQIAQAASRE